MFHFSLSAVLCLLNVKCIAGAVGGKHIQYSSAGKLERQ